MNSRSDLRHMLTDATIISAVVIYSYIMYISGEIGYLIAFNIDPDYAISLVSLDVQTILVAFLNGIISSLYILALISVLIVIVAALFRVGLNDTKRIKRLGLGVISMLFIVSASPFLIDRVGFWPGIIATVAIVGFAMFPMIIRIPVSRKRSISIDSMLDALSRKILKSTKIGNQFLQKSTFFVFLPFLILISPILNFVISYNGVSVGNIRNTKITTIEDREYLIIKQYSDKLILVEVQDSALTPNYLIQMDTALEEIHYRIEKNGKLNNDTLFR